MSDTAGTMKTSSNPGIGGAYLRWGLVALLQLILIALPLTDRLDVQWNGKVVPLELVPVDPRDLLRGDYVVINLAINRLPKDIRGGDEISVGDQVFVELAAQDKQPAKPVAVAKAREDVGRLAIAGTVRLVSSDRILIDYGIDAFFLPEGEGKVIEELDTSRVLLEVSVADDGRSLPLTLLVDGKAFRSDATF